MVFTSVDRGAQVWERYRFVTQRWPPPKAKSHVNLDCAYVPNTQGSSVHGTDCAIYLGVSFGGGFQISGLAPL